jgi:dTDP-4-dehydrorhamnose reductase
MKIFVTGAAGLLGSKFMEMKLPESIEVIGSDLSKPKDYFSGHFVQLDITEKENVLKTIREHSPDCVIHSAAITNVDYCENHQADAAKVNIGGTRNVVEAASKVGAKVVFMSSDYVFDGESGPYREEDIPNPIGFYGSTKLQGEGIVKKQSAEHIIARSTVIFGYHSLDLENFATWLIKNLKSGEKVNVVNDQFSNPTLANNCAEMIIELLERKESGIYNVVGKDYVSRYEFACKIADSFGLDKSLISPVSTSELKQLAKRPRLGGFKIEKISKLGIHPLGIGESLEIMKEDMISNWEKK